MKVLHISSPMSWRGGEQQLAYLHAGLGQHGIEQAVFCAKNGELYNKFKARGYSVVGFKKSFSQNPLTAWKLKKFCHRFQPDLIHCHDSHAHSIAFVAGFLLNNPVPLVLHRRVDYELKSNILSRLKYNYNKIKAIICVSELVRQIVINQVKRTEQVQTIYSCINPDRFKNIKRGKLREEIGAEQNTPIIANIAAISDQKDYVTWVKTVELLSRQLPNAKFVIIGGDGGQEEQILQLIRKKNLIDKVYLLGYRKDIPDLIKDIDVLLFSSKKEGLGTTILDAFLNKIPVVATRVGGIPELVRHEKTGLLTEVGDYRSLAKESIRILQTKSLRNELTEAAYSYQKSFHCSKMVKDTYLLYRSILTHIIE